MGVYKAARLHGIPATTLKRRLKIKTPVINRLGPDSVLGEINEKKITTHIKKLQAHGFAPDRNAVRSMAYRLADQYSP